VRVGIAGLGVVGATLARMMLPFTDDEGESIFAQRAHALSLNAVCARDRNKERGFDTSALVWFEDPVSLATSDTIDVFVELIGGEEGPARDAVTAALSAGKHVITANKALLARHGLELARLAEKNGVNLGFEAAVAGAVPIVRAMTSTMAPSSVDRVVGILNGTCNYILSEMERKGADFATALADAQARGFAEADPALDINGDDAAHKIALLSSIAFGVWPAGVFKCDDQTNERLFVEGISHIQPYDIKLADQNGYRIRLIGVAERHAPPILGGDGSGFALMVRPFLVAKDHAIAQASGPENLIMVQGEPTGRIVLAGPGAGGGPTASAVATDLLAILNGETGPVFGRPATSIMETPLYTSDRATARFYVRVRGLDKDILKGSNQLSSFATDWSANDDLAGITAPVTLEAMQNEAQTLVEKGCSVTTLRIAEF